MTHDVRVSSLTFDRYCHEIGYQTDLLAGHVKGADGTAPRIAFEHWAEEKAPRDEAHDDREKAVAGGHGATAGSGRGRPGLRIVERGQRRVRCLGHGQKRK